MTEVRRPLASRIRAPRILAATLVAVLGAVPAAQASSPAAWTQHEKDTRQACAAASELKDPVVHAYVALFDDSVGMDARLVTGTWKPAHMKGAKAVMLCLYDRKARRAVVQDAEGWRDAFAAPASTAGKPAVKAPAPVAPPKAAPPKSP